MALREYGQPVDIVIDMLNMQPLGVVVTNDDVTPDPATGEVFIERGTPLYATENPFDNRQTVLTVTATGATCYGLTRYRVYFEEGETLGGTAMVYGGVVDSAKIPNFSTVITTAIREALPLLTFRAGREVLE